MLQSHLNCIESIILAQSSAASNAGHPNLRGGPREWFIRDFLSSHLPSSLEIGQGEIIDSHSTPNPSPGNYRPQIDVVIYRRDLPKITYSKDNSAFLAEGVPATIECKSTLSSADLENSCRASLVHKNMRRNVSSFGWYNREAPPHILSYVVAYDGPASMRTVYGWIPTILSNLSTTPDLIVDVVIILGRGVLWKRSAFPELAPAGGSPSVDTSHNWLFLDQANDNLLVLFSHMLRWLSNVTSPPSIFPYVQRVRLSNVSSAP